MGTTYEVCGNDVQKLLSKAMSEYHPDLAAHKVTVQAVFARNYDKEQNPVPAVKMHGHPAAAKISVTSLQDRARGLADAKLLIDGNKWEHLSQETRIALLDHELEHLIAGEERDDLGRPKLQTRHHDYLLAGFESILQRHGNKAIEHREMTNFQTEYGQLFLPGIENGKAK
jgi:hypothetical protein